MFTPLTVPPARMLALISPPCPLMPPRTSGRRGSARRPGRWPRGAGAPLPLEIAVDGQAVDRAPLTATPLPLGWTIRLPVTPGCPGCGRSRICPPELSTTEPLTVNVPSWSRPIESTPSWLIVEIALAIDRSRPSANRPPIDESRRHHLSWSADRARRRRRRRSGGAGLGLVVQELFDELASLRDGVDVARDRDVAGRPEVDARDAQRADAAVDVDLGLGPDRADIERVDELVKGVIRPVELGRRRRQARRAVPTGCSGSGSPGAGWRRGIAAGSG